MIEAERFVRAAQARGYDFYSGVPCSFLTPLINFVISDRDTHYVGVASEGEAIGIAVGGHLAGRRSVAMAQNSGLGNMVNPLTSLAYTFRIPLLLVVTHRGEPGLSDAPQHELMGRITPDLFETMEIPWARFPTEDAEVEPVLERVAVRQAETSLPYALIMSKGSVAKSVLGEQGYPARATCNQAPSQVGGDLPGRTPALEAMLTAVPDSAAIVSTTGKTSRELFVVSDRPNNFYVVGSMGCAAGIGLGVALARPERPVVVLDGDGAALMKLGTMATIGHFGPDNLVHVLIDNHVHDSTGAQATVAPTVDFTAVAAGCNYRHTWSVSGRQDIAEAVRAAHALPGPNLVHIRTVPGSPPDLPRPTQGPLEIRDRFMEFLAGS